MLVNARTWTEFKKTPDPSNMIEMMMGDYSMRDGSILRRENSRECSEPRLFTLACIYQEAVMAGADDVCVCA